MEILQIRSDAVKVMLSAEETAAFGFDEPSVHDRTHFVNAVRKILTLAGEGCTIGDGRLLVQLFTSKAGDTEIFVRELPRYYLTQEQGRRSAEFRLPGTAIDGRRYIYSFEGISPMLHTCNRLRFAGYSGDSSAYKDGERRRFYLMLDMRTPLPEEHGGTLCKRGTLYYINEHCSLICTGAVETLGVLV